MKSSQYFSSDDDTMMKACAVIQLQCVKHYTLGLPEAAVQSRIRAHWTTNPLQWFSPYSNDSNESDKSESVIQSRAKWILRVQHGLPARIPGCCKTGNNILIIAYLKTTPKCCDPVTTTTNTDCQTSTFEYYDPVNTTIIKTSAASAPGSKDPINTKMKIWRVELSILNELIRSIL